MKGVTRRAMAKALVLLAIVAGAGLYLTGGAKPVMSDVSPDGRERLELASPSRWEWLTGPSADMAVTARIFDVASGSSSVRSPVFEASGEAETFWEADRVQIGSSAAYNRTTGKWTITQ